MKAFIFSIFFLLSATFMFSQTDATQYLLQNKHTIKLDDTEKFSFLTPDFYNNQIYLFGENHGSSQPHDVDFQLFKQLYQKENVRHYIAEVDQIKAWMLNNFLKDGDENWLTKVFKSWKAEGAQWANQSNWNKYKKLHDFYTSLPENEKFEIIGIDVIQDYSLLNDYFKYFLNNKSSKNEAIVKFIAISDTVQYGNRKILGELARKIASDIKVNNQYKKELKSNLSDFELFIKNAGYTGNKMYRDSIMYKTFDDIVVTKNLKDKKMYGFLGFYHTLQTKYEGRNPFAACVKLYSNQNKIVSLQMLALNSKVLLPYNAQIKKLMPPNFVAQLRKESPDFPFTEKYIPYELSNDNAMMKVEGIEELKSQCSENSVTFFKLNSVNSPYTHGKKLAEITGFQALKMTNENEVTTNAFQYAVLFRNSPAALPIP
jgi:hypothetical protein